MDLEAALAAPYYFPRRLQRCAYTARRASELAGGSGVPQLAHVDLLEDALERWAVRLVRARRVRTVSAAAALRVVRSIRSWAGWSELAAEQLRKTKGLVL